MNHTLLTPRYYRNEESFTLLASDNNRLTKEKDGSVSYQPFVTHQHIVQPDIQPKWMGIDINTEERKIKDISHLQSKMIRDQLIGERDIFTKYGYDEANELNEIISEIKTIKNTQKGVTNVIAQIGWHLDLLVQAAEANNISMNDN